MPSPNNAWESVFRVEGFEKDYHQQLNLLALEELIRQGDVELVLPRTIVEEFSRNQGRAISDSNRSLSSALKRAKEAVEGFGDPGKRTMALELLNDVDHRLPSLGSAAVGSIDRIEKIFASTPIVEISDSVKLRAAQRAIDPPRTIS